MQYAAGLVLPNDVRTDLAYQEVRRYPDAVVQQGVAIDVPGEYWELFVTIGFTFTTDADVFNRHVRIVELAEQGALEVAHIGAPGVQPASTVYAYLFSHALTAGIGPTGNYAAAPLFPTPLAPGSRLYITEETQLGLADQFRDVWVRSIRYPTGPEPDLSPFEFLPADLSLAGTIAA